MWHFVLIICAATPLFAAEGFIKDRLVLAWRVHMTDSLVSAFFANEAYYRIVHMGGVDNPDQRITQDVDAFVTSSTAVMAVLISKLFNCVAFGGAAPITSCWPLSEALSGRFTHLGVRSTPNGCVCRVHPPSNLPMERAVSGCGAPQACCGASRLPSWAS